MRPARLTPLFACLTLALAATMGNSNLQPVAASGPESGFRVLKSIQSGDLTLFPVIRADGRSLPGDQFLTLDEGLKSGEVEVTEYGKVRGLVRDRSGRNDLVAHATPRYQGDQVNTLVLVNNSKRPLLLLAGEIVTGGKQDRVIAKDRIVPAGADPIDLSVFCVEHGRWTESSAKFGGTASNATGSFMVQPQVRQQVMDAKSQQQVWNSVDQAVTSMARAAAPPKMAQGNVNDTVTVEAEGGVHGSAALGTTSYAKAMQKEAVSAQVDKESAGVLQSREQALKTLRDEHAVGVVVAVRGEVIWADIFSDPELLTRYWIKLVRSYAAEGLAPGPHRKDASIADAQAFLDSPAHGREDSEGEVGVYRYREVKANGTDTFSLEALLPGTNYDVHISKLKLKGPQVSELAKPPLF
jgi:hypothetical protein